MRHPAVRLRTLGSTPLLAGFLVARALAAPPSLAIDHRVAAPGASIAVPVSFLTQSGSAAAIQFDLEWDSSVMSLTATVGDSARLAGKDVSRRDLGDGRGRFMIVGLNGNPIPDGALLNVLMDVRPDAAAGVYTVAFSNISCSDADGGSVTVAAADGTLDLQGDAVGEPPLTADGVLNGASLRAGPVAPGEIVTLMGPGIGSGDTPAAGLRVLFNDAPAPVLLAIPNQVNTVVPPGLAAPGDAILRVECGGTTRAEIHVEVTPFAPGVFTANASGTGQAAAWNDDGTLNSEALPAHRGSTVSLFATGVGPLTEGPGIDPALALSAQVGGLDAVIVEAVAGVAGLLQVKCRIPESAPTGGSVPVVLRVADIPSQPGVSIAVQ